MRNYSSEEIVASWSGIRLEEGFAEGSFMVPRRNSQTWRQRSNGLGGTIRLYNPDRSGEVDFTINAESIVNQALTSLSILDRLTRTVQGPLWVRDLNTGEAFIFTNAYIVTEPDDQRATSSVDVTWTFAFTTIDHAPNLSNSNLVGS